MTLPTQPAKFKYYFVTETPNTIITKSIDLETAQFLITLDDYEVDINDIDETVYIKRKQKLLHG